MKKAKVFELKAHLSAYLAEVKRGETIVVCERTTPIARLTPYQSAGDDVKLIPPVYPASRLAKLEPVKPRKRVDVVRLLREDRDQR